MSTRKAIPIDVRRLVLHECGYHCSNPGCHTPITLDIHHLVQVSKGGGDSAENLLPLCPNCHSLHHRKIIPVESIRTWKMLLLTLNEGFDRNVIELLLALNKIGALNVSGDGVLLCASLIASGMAESVMGKFNPDGGGVIDHMNYHPTYTLRLTSKGHSFIDNWIKGDQPAAIDPLGNA